MSSRVGSIPDDGSGGSYASRAPTTALEQYREEHGDGPEGDVGVVVVLMPPWICQDGTGHTRGTTHQMKEAVEPEEAAERVVESLYGEGDRGE